ncbi:MAG: hypothetical protein JEZ04_20940 [Spirochaetales bacterium]|nr:hypothetical protein [Spirochaetales bacterium]
MLFGTSANKAAAEIAKLAVRDTSNFNWTFIVLLAIVIYIYATEFKNRNFKGIAAGLALYTVHWFFEIINAVICSASGYALWTVSPESTSYILLVGVSWELSMMFIIAGLALSKLLPEDRSLKIAGINNRIFFAIANAALFSVIEIFLASTPAFLWVYPWWGALPVFITTYIPFFLAAFIVYDLPGNKQKRFILSIAAVDIILLAVLIPLGII